LVLRHKIGNPLDLSTGFEKVETERNVTFDDDDVWFGPSKPYQLSEDKNNLLCINGRRLDSGALEYLEQRHYGFKLPDNKANVDYIIVDKFAVTVKEATDSNKEKNKILKRQHEKKNYYFPGYLP